MKRTLAVPAILIALVTVARVDRPVQAQNTLARRVAQAPDGTVGLAYPARAEVCGDGHSFVGEKLGGGQLNIYSAQGMTIGAWGDGDMNSRCVHGPVRVILEVRGGKVVDVRPYVGGTRSIPARTELGDVTAAEAAQYLLQVARNESEDLASEAMLAAALGQGARITETLLQYAADDELRSDLREAALKWVGRAAEREGTTARAVESTRTIALQNGAALSLRERALRVLGELPGGDRSLRSVYERLDHSDLKERVVRVVAESGGPDNAAFVRAIALNQREALEIRERALRLLGEELGDVKLLRSLYTDVDEESLRERIIRTVGENGSADDLTWLRQIVLDASQNESVRERALRVLGDNGSTATLRELFPRLQPYALRERVVRIIAERGGREDLLWVEQLVTASASESELRERAIRLLAESGVPSSRLATIFDRSDDPTVRERIVRLLGERSDDAARTKLREIARSDPDHDLRERARRILAEAGLR